MPEHTLPDSRKIPESNDENETTLLHTCACGEQHRHRQGTPSHRETCTSPMKFGDTCCCGAAKVPQSDNHRCGHGPRCQ